MPHILENMTTIPGYVVVSMVNSQYEVEDKFEIDGYTVDNPNVILNVYEQIMSADSKGRALKEAISVNGFKYKRLED